MNNISKMTDMSKTNNMSQTTDNGRYVQYDKYIQNRGYIQIYQSHPLPKSWKGNPAMEDDLNFLKMEDDLNNFITMLKMNLLLFLPVLAALYTVTDMFGIGCCVLVP